MHYLAKFDETMLKTPNSYRNHSKGYTENALVDQTCGSVHTSMAICQLAPSGVLNSHYHTYEEGVYILQGEVLISIDEQAYHLKAGDWAVLPVGKPHAWHNVGAEFVQWLQMAAPQPKLEGGLRHTFFLKSGDFPTEAQRLDPSNTQGNLLGHFGLDKIPSPNEEAYTAVSGRNGTFLNWLIDENMGAIHHRLLLVEFQPGVSIALHDHPFEECCFILSGELECILDGERYVAKAEQTRFGRKSRLQIGCGQEHG
ncbi:MULTISPECIES: cupin domain-containing protein [unclassified Moorena]|uniref:cupin domain-containing protein n=1 Tax=unclassified Moorena TaxID=2683338 RepID=UPI0013F7E69D|nr:MULTISPECIES: cupin domain-containing protein [unclassified Moorena]NEO11757.1 cupin domain-containing protein [Moorena sp. SIO3E8]NEP27731.1 cupin domain-containing protein [Moorena sp. SIO3I6]NEP98342.1 cupin domain-containing protein [Moorena sp. SIO3F7]